MTAINLARVDLREFLWTLAAGLGLNPADDESGFRLWRLVSDRLSERRYQQLRTTLIGDDAHLASDEMLAAVSQLLPLAGGESRLTIVLATREQRQRRIEAEVGDSVDLRIDLEPWTETETADFLRTSLARAGVTRDIFDERASRRLHVLSRGVPRLARKIGELALAAGAAQELALIDEATVEDVFSEIVSAFSPPSASRPSFESTAAFESLVIR